MHPTTFLFLAFGDNLNNHTMANFAFLTIKKFAPANSRIVIYTDRAAHYQCSSSFVEIREMSEQTQKLWQGEHQFLWRIKIMAMLDSANRDAGHLMYLDTDCAAIGDLASLIQKLEEGKCLMHIRENLLCEDKASNKKLMWQQTQNKSFGGIKVDQTSAMWNAGVVAIGENKKRELLTKALQSCDEMLDQNVEKWLIEQFSLSQALSATHKLEAADQWIAHYWGNKEEWIHNIHHFFSKCFQQKLSLEQMVNQLDTHFWKSLPIVRYQKSSHKKLVRLANRFFPDSVKKS